MQNTYCFCEVNVCSLVQMTLTEAKDFIALLSVVQGQYRRLLYELWFVWCCCCVTYFRRDVISVNRMWFIFLSYKLRFFFKKKCLCWDLYLVLLEVYFWSMLEVTVGGYHLCINDSQLAPNSFLCFHSHQKCLIIFYAMLHWCSYLVNLELKVVVFTFTPVFLL